MTLKTAHKNGQGTVEPTNTGSGFCFPLFPISCPTLQLGMFDPITLVPTLNLRRFGVGSATLRQVGGHLYPIAANAPL